MAFDPNDPDTKAALKAAVDEAKEGQDTKNAELLNEVKKLKADLRKVKEISPDDVAAIEAERDKLSTDLAAATKTAKDATTAAEKATKALEQESGFTHKLVAENGVLKALTDAGVTDPAYLEAAKAMHLPNIKIVPDGDNRNALYGDKPLADAIKEWAAGDVGKKFVAAPVNGGGGAQGSGNAQGGGKTASRAAFDAMDQGARAAFTKEGGKVVDQAA